MVRLKGPIRQESSEILVRFQSHCGAIKSDVVQAVAEYVETSFNPTVVRLKAVAVKLGVQEFVGFNPTVVRLKDDDDDPSEPDCYWFQSHCGAIKSNTPGTPRDDPSLRFQSHCGAIKRVLLAGRYDSCKTVSIPLWCD